MNNKNLYINAIVARNNGSEGLLLVVELLTNNRVKVRAFGEPSNANEWEVYSSELRMARPDEIRA